MNKAASQLGKLAAGVPKKFSAEEIAKRTARLRKAQKERAKTQRSLRRSNAVIDTEPTIFRIDTATGRTWQLIGVPAVIQGTRGHVNGWQPVSENPWRTAEAMTQPSKTASPPK